LAVLLKNLRAINLCWFLLQCLAFDKFLPC
jgi:hypothetical protein